MPKSQMESPSRPQNARLSLAGGVSNFLNSVADAGLELLSRRRADADPPTDIETQCNELLSTLGEASGTALARRLMRSYEQMDDGERLDFFALMREKFHVDYDAIRQAALDLDQMRDNRSLKHFLRVSEPARQELFRRLNMAPNGTRSLVEMRRDLLKALREYPDLEPVDEDMAHLFSSWFNRGFLTLKSIDWNTPAAVLEKLIQYETVHEMRGWDDLHRRLAPDRRCFAFFHSALPEDPLIFVEVALVRGIARDIAPIISLDRTEITEKEADTAIFYSINNCLEGLKGVSFGNFLIKQVVIELARELPHLITYSTLSPVPGFARWLQEAVLSDSETSLVDPEQRDLLAELDVPNWFEDESICTAIETLLTRLIAHYLTYAKRGDDPLDTVARFHLRNGARLDKINWLGDVSDERMRQSHGFLVNYVYDLETIEKNHEIYVKEHIVVTSDEVAALANDLPVATKRNALGILRHL